MLNIFKRRNVDPAQVMGKSLGAMTLPTFPAGMMTTLQYLRDPDCPIEKIALSIEANPGIVTQVLRVVNSSAYGLRQRVNRVSHAISMLGRGQVELLVVASAVKGGLEKSVPKPANARFWKGAAVQASLARSLAELIDPPSQSEAFIGGMLQDMALPLLFTARAKEYRPLVEACMEDKTKRLDELEQEAFGWDHSTIGACVAHEWKLPTGLTEGIGGHHEGTTSAAIHLVSHVRTGNGTPDVSALPAVAEEKYGVPADQVSSAIERGTAHAAELLRLLN